MFQASCILHANFAVTISIISPFIENSEEVKAVSVLENPKLINFLLIISKLQSSCNFNFNLEFVNDVLGCIFLIRLKYSAYHLSIY